MPELFFLSPFLVNLFGLVFFFSLYDKLNELQRVDGLFVQAVSKAMSSSLEHLFLDITGTLMKPTALTVISVVGDF